MTGNCRNALLRKENQPVVLRSPPARYRSMILVSINIRYMRIFVGVPRGGASNDSGVVEDGNFSSVQLALFGNFRQDI